MNTISVLVDIFIDTWFIGYGRRHKYITFVPATRSKTK